MIYLEGVTKTFHSSERSYTALKTISLTIQSAEYLAIVGKSGSGKSTLLNMIAGIDHPTEGIIRINDTQINELDEDQLARWRGKNIGIVFQFFQLIPTLTICENLLLAMEFVNVIPRSQRETRAITLLTQVGIADQADKMPASLSGGQQQRAAIARALANDPPVILADEPTGNLDSKTASSVHQIFRELAENGKTVLVVTHEKDTSLKYQRTIWLADGEIVTPPVNEIIA
ncbi:ABC transporter ATP-binding protein [Cytophagaceae bacterium DM2B3-1]|uniref:ABC transporter ATP-binding protein n=1 Tax=Xanthocytophaga flava TaxID=3048013 RepID=A0ABT7CQI4_9BACT|nr:ABC transporter ATP-binding protein [Xanthocytophaga flavus]MDJ1496007.1 ABC transporter ATP-binding protein [Xanthocytophaga flavus]